MSISTNINEYKLENGLLILLKENHNSSTISFNVVYRVGSKYECPGLTGISHLIEHMMFKSTKNHPLGQFDRLITLCGADGNAYTWLDETVYYELIDKDKIDVALELEADRMQNLLLNEEEHAYEMTVVKNELEQREDSPHVLLLETMINFAFQVHPYSIPTIGRVEDVVGITTEDLRKYYKKYYHPDGAFIVAVGGFNSEELLEKIKKYFGGIPKGNISLPIIPREPPQLGQRRFVIKKSGNTDYIVMGFHIPEGENEDSYPLTTLSQILGIGKTSRLYKALVETGMASYVFASASPFNHADPFLFIIGAGVNNGVAPEEVEKRIFAEIEMIQKNGITEEELRRAIKQAKVSFIYDKDSVNSEAQTIITFELASSYRDIERYLPSLELVSLSDIKRVANSYLTPEKATIGYFIGLRGSGNNSNKDIANIPQPLNLSEKVNFLQVAPSRLSSSKSDKGVSFTLEKVNSTTIASYENGLKVLVLESHQNETVAISGYVLAGAIFNEPEKRGLARLTGDMLIRGTSQMGSDEIAQLLEDNGMELIFSGGREHTSISAKCITEDLSTLLGLLFETLRFPSFEEEELSKAKLIIDNEITRLEDSTFERALFSARDELLGTDNPYAGMLTGTHESLASITREELVEFHSTYFKPSSTTITIVGDVNAESVIREISMLIHNWQTDSGQDVDFSAYYLASEKLCIQSEKFIRIDMPDKSNVSLVFVKKGLNRCSSDFYSAMVANFIFGGDFMSRLNERLRVKEGLTYGSLSFFQPGRGAGPWVISVQVNPESIDKAIEIVKEEWHRFFADGVTEDELYKAKSYFTGNFSVRLDTIYAISSLLADIEYFSLGYDYMARYKDIISSLTLADVNEAIKRRFNPERWVLAIAGSLSEVQP